MGKLDDEVERIWQVSDAIVERAKEAVRKAEDRRRAIDGLTQRATAFRQSYEAVARCRADPSPRGEPAFRISITPTSHGTPPTPVVTIPDALTARTISAILALLSGELEQVTAELERIE